MSGPRLCALRIPNGGGNVLIDNIESDSTPVIYTRRSRFLDEELDENKDIITTSQYPTPNGSADQRNYHKISMLMSDGVVTLMSNESKSESHKGGHKMADGTSTEVAQNYDECSQRDDCEQSNQKYCPNSTHMSTTESMGLDRAYNGLTLNEHDLSPSNVFGQALKDQGTMNDASDLKDPMVAADKQSQILHMHQFRQQQSHPLSLVDETSLLRRQQLSQSVQMTRVAEWVQNNNHEACIGNPDADYKPITKLNNNEISNRSVDRIKSMINCNSVPMNDLEAGKQFN